MNCLHEFSWDGFNKIFDETFSTKGYLAEQFVAQHLAYHLNKKAQPELMYWLRDKNINKAEIDFITSSKSEIVFLPLPSDDPKDREPDISKAKELLRWEPKISREDGLKRTIEDVQRQLATK